MTAPSESLEFVESREPGSPQVVIGRFRLHSADEALAALERATRATRDWRSLASRRSEALTNWATCVEREGEGLARLVAREVGKPIREARGEVGRVVALLRYYAQIPFDPTGEIFPASDGQSRLMTERRPLGTILAITPWNFPLAIPIWKMAPALAYGNCVLFRPSSAAIACATRLVELGRNLLPEGVLEFVPTAARDVERLLDDPRLAGVTFTGSTPVGRYIIERMARRAAPTQAEMGGQNPSIVLRDADLERAAVTIAEAAMAYAGQKCTATSRIIVDRSVASDFLPLLVDAVEALGFGSPTDEDTTVGPLISDGARQEAQRARDGAIRRGGRLLTGEADIDGEGWYFRPTLVEVDGPDDQLAQEETFAPIAAVLKFDDDDEAASLANAARYGLSAAVFTQDLERGRRLASEVDAGVIRVNASTAGVDFYTPFGGERDSSYGPREQGRAASEFFTRTRTILIAP